MSALIHLPQPRRHGRRSSHRPDVVRADSLKEFNGKKYQNRQRIRRATIDELKAAGTAWTPTPNHSTRKLSYGANGLIDRICQEPSTFIWKHERIAKICKGDVTTRRLRELLAELREQGYMRIYCSGAAAHGQDRAGKEYEFTN